MGQRAQCANWGREKYFLFFKWSKNWCPLKACWLFFHIKQHKKTMKYCFALSVGPGSEVQTPWRVQREDTRVKTDQGGCCKFNVESCSVSPWRSPTSGDWTFVRN